MKPTVSVVIPAYNKGDFIKETINSVLAQTYSNYEIIVVDDGSTDNTAEIVKSIKDERLRYFYQPNSGLPAVPRNKGGQLSSSEYIAFLDHDDLWMANKLEKQMSIIEKDHGIALICTNAFYLYDKKVTQIPFLNGLKSGYFYDKKFLPEMNAILSTVLIRKSVFQEMGGFNEVPELKAFEDYDLWLRIYPRYNCYYLNECLAYYRQYPYSTSGSELHSVERALRHYHRYFASYGFSQQVGYKRLSRLLHQYSCLQFISGDKRYLANARRAFQLNRRFTYFLFYCFFLLPRQLTIRLYKIYLFVKSYGREIISNLSWLVYIGNHKL